MSDLQAERRARIDTILTDVRAFARDFPQRLMPGYYPVSGKVYDEHEIVNLIEATLDCHWTEGRFATQLAQGLAEYVGVREAVLTNSGSSANLIAIQSLTSPLLPKGKRLEAGDEVITAAAAFPTTVNPILQAGCVPVFLDIDIETHNLDLTHLEDALSERTRAVSLAHTLGNPFDLDRIQAFCREHDLWFLEDSCDALGGTYKGKMLGSFGDFATISFYPAHQMTCGEGGTVLCNDPSLIKIAKSLRDWGRDCWCPTGQDNTCGKRFGQQHGDLPFGYDHKYVYSHLGYNLKLTDFQAGIGVAQLDKLPGFVAARKRNHAEYLSFFREQGFEKYFHLPRATEGSDPCWYGFGLTVREDAPFERAKLLAHLNDNGVQTRTIFAGNIVRQPSFTRGEVPHRVVGSLENTDLLMNNAFYVGVYPGITPDRCAEVQGIFREFLDRA